MEDYSPTDLEHIIDSECSIRLFTDGNKTLFDQCAEWIGHDSISTITIMSPFYDRNGSLIKALYNKYRPGEIRVIYEDDFGTHPKTSDISGYTKFYKWQDVLNTNHSKLYQDLFHAKCFFFEGEHFNYMLCGSTNASVAAFGIPGADSMNHEASVGYKSNIYHHQLSPEGVSGMFYNLHYYLLIPHLLHHTV